MCVRSCPAGHCWVFSDFRLKLWFHIRLVWDVTGGCLRAYYELFGSCIVSYWSKNQVWHWILKLLLFSVCDCHSGLRLFFWKNRCRTEPQLWTNSAADCHNEIIDCLLFPFLMLNPIQSQKFLKRSLRCQSTTCMLVLLKFGFEFIIAVVDRYQQTKQEGVHVSSPR